MPAWILLTIDQIILDCTDSNKCLSLSNFSIILIKTFGTFYLPTFLIFMQKVAPDNQFFPCITVLHNKFGLKSFLGQISAETLIPLIKFQSEADVLSSVCVTRLFTYFLKWYDLSYIYCNFSIESGQNFFF